MDARLEQAVSRLARHIGEQPARETFSEALRAAGVTDKHKLEPQELYRVATALVAKGGLVELVGRTVKVQALMLGAVAPAEDVRASMERLSRR